MKVSVDEHAAAGGEGVVELPRQPDQLAALPGGALGLVQPGPDQLADPAKRVARG